MALLIENLNKKYDDILLYRDFSISFTEGIITCILGPSGCGKTTLLNIIGGITHHDSGNLSGFEGKLMSYIFQDPRLLLWKTVRGNIEFVMDRSISSKERKKYFCPGPPFTAMENGEGQYRICDGQKYFL